MGSSRRAGKRPLVVQRRGDREYRVGVAALVAGGAHASRLLATAIALDPGFALARRRCAVALALEGRPYEPLPRAACAINRAERQHLEVVQAALSGSVRRAHDLRREHLLEFPGDVLIVWLPVVQHEMRPGVTIDSRVTCRLRCSRADRADGTRATRAGSAPSRSPGGS